MVYFLSIFQYFQSSTTMLLTCVIVASFFLLRHRFSYLTTSSHIVVVSSSEYIITNRLCSVFILYFLQYDTNDSIPMMITYMAQEYLSFCCVNLLLILKLHNSFIIGFFPFYYVLINFVVSCFCSKLYNN